LRFLLFFSSRAQDDEAHAYAWRDPSSLVAAVGRDARRWGGAEDGMRRAAARETTGIWAAPQRPALRER
jgi:hypothetical protein